jgi:hypothetical protein
MVAVGRLLLGSVADQVVRNATMPVLLVPQRSLPWDGHEPLRGLVALDGSHIAEAALAPPKSSLAKWC